MENFIFCAVNASSRYSMVPRKDKHFGFALTKLQINNFNSSTRKKIHSNHSFKSKQMFVPILDRRKCCSITNMQGVFLGVLS